MCSMMSDMSLPLLSIVIPRNEKLKTIDPFKETFDRTPSNWYSFRCESDLKNVGQACGLHGVHCLAVDESIACVDASQAIVIFKTSVARKVESWWNTFRYQDRRPSSMPVRVESYLQDWTGYLLLAIYGASQ